MTMTDCIGIQADVIAHVASHQSEGLVKYDLGRSILTRDA
jgi:hypothetical protein